MAAADVCDNGAIGWACDAAGAVLGGVTGIGTEAGISVFAAILDYIVKWMLEGAAELLALVVAFWVYLDAAEVGCGGDGGPVQADGPIIGCAAGPIAALQANTYWLTAVVAVMALLIGAGQIAMQRDGRELREIFKGLLMLVVLSGIGVPAVALLNDIGDEYSSWIVHKAADGDLGERVLLLVGLEAGVLVISREVGVAIAMIAAVILMLSGLLQCRLLLARTGAMVLLLGLLPLAAAFGVTSRGRHVRQRYVTWLIALTAYKPVAATVYAGAFWMVGKSDDVLTVFAALLMLLIAIVALPALMRLISPVAVMGTDWWSGGGGRSGSAPAEGASSDPPERGGRPPRPSGSSGGGRGGGGGRGPRTPGGAGGDGGRRRAGPYPVRPGSPGNVGGGPPPGSGGRLSGPGGVPVRPGTPAGGGGGYGPSRHGTIPGQVVTGKGSGASATHAAGAGARAGAAGAGGGAIVGSAGGGAVVGSAGGGAVVGAGAAGAGAGAGVGAGVAAGAGVGGPVGAAAGGAAAAAAAAVVRGYRIGKKGVGAVRSFGGDAASAFDED